MRQAALSSFQDTYNVQLAEDTLHASDITDFSATVRNDCRIAVMSFPSFFKANSSLLQTDGIAVLASNLVKLQPYNCKCQPYPCLTYSSIKHQIWAKLCIA